MNVRNFYDKRIKEDPTIGSVQLMEEYHQAKLKSLGINDVSARLSSSLGEVEGNAYEVVFDEKNDSFWISHKYIGSGEPLKQWIDDVLNVR